MIAPESSGQLQSKGDERGVMRDLLIEAQTGEPTPRQVHAQFLHQFAFAGDAVQIADQENAQQELRINRGTTGLAVAVS